MTFSLCGRAELIRALAQNDLSTTASMADMLGYHEAPLIEREPKEPPSEPQPLPEPEAPEVLDIRYDPVDVPFWRLERYESVSNDASQAERPARTYGSWRRRPTATPGFTPLAPKRVVLTQLRQALATRRSTRDLDDEAAVERLSRASFLDDVPTRQRRAWGSELLLVKDRARRLMPYWQDQDFVVDAFSGCTRPTGSPSPACGIARVNQSRHGAIRRPRSYRKRRFLCSATWAVWPMKEKRCAASGWIGAVACVRSVRLQSPLCRLMRRRLLRNWPVCGLSSGGMRYQPQSRMVFPKPGPVSWNALSRCCPQL